MNTREYHFPACGCKIPINEAVADHTSIFGRPSLIYQDDPEFLNHECRTTWDMLAEGLTKGVFQLESSLGRQYAKKLRPESIDHLSALGALLRPGCISGDTTISIYHRTNRPRNLDLRKVTIRQLYNQHTRKHCLYGKRIVSLNEQSNLLFNNKIEDVTYSGEKEVYKLFFEGRSTSSQFFGLECTLDHKLLTLTGWKELKDINPGEYLAVIKKQSLKSRHIKNQAGEKHFRQLCRYAYQYKCVMCEWNNGSLDVNHLEGNRKTNNSPENLSFLCPNHHRMYTEGNLSKDEVIACRERHRLPNTNHIQWRRFERKESSGIKDTYDISVNGPNHNFIAGNVVVHNCLKAKDDKGISMTDHFCLRKNGLEETTYLHPALEPLLNDTYGVLTYQEQAMAIAVALAGFTPQQADDLRKAIGKKKTDVMAEVKGKFLKGAITTGIIDEDTAAAIFGWIEKSQRYSFNKSHALSYALIGYHTAHLKAHFPLQFFTGWLWHAKNKQEPLIEIRELINEAKIMGFKVLPPRLEDLKYQFTTDGVVITFGLSDIKGIKNQSIQKMRDNMLVTEKDISLNRMEWGWLDFLVHFSPTCNKTVVNRMIATGAMARYPFDRQRMLAEYEIYRELTEKEQNFVSRVKSLGHTDDDETTLFKREIDEEPNVVHINSLLDALEMLLVTPKAIHDKRRREKVATYLKMLKNPARALVDTPEWIAKTEQECLGIPLTCSRVEGQKDIKADTTCQEYRAGKDTGIMTMAVDIQDFREVKIQNGKNIGRKMAFLTVADASGSLEDICVFSDAWDKYNNMIFNGATVEISGRRDENRGSFIVEEVWLL